MAGKIRQNFKPEGKNNVQAGKRKSKIGHQKKLEAMELFCRENNAKSDFPIVNCIFSVDNTQTGDYKVN